jgi:non-ribosomal peptide synthetase component E (peptide arylation enzyme)
VVLHGRLGHIDSDGYICVTARKKEQISRAGETISPRVVDEALGRLEVGSIGY